MNASFGAQALAVLRKDIIAEWRSTEILITSVFFGFMVVLVFSFSFFRGDAPLSVVGAGILWVSVAFAGNLALARLFERERQHQCLKGLLMLGVRPSALYLGKTTSVVGLMLLLQTVITVSVVFFFSLNLPVLRLGALAGVLFLGAVGFAAVGVTLWATLLDTRGRDVLVSVVLYPLVLPVLIIGVKATTALFETHISWTEFGLWLRILVAFDMLFLVAGASLFGLVTVESS
ncbi:MAG: heme exporter protein CcmB [Myxococcota bacterium]